LVVETDSLRYHRDAFKQSADKKRDNTNARSGFVTLRFSHRHVRYEPAYVLSELRAVARTLQRKREGLLVLPPQ
jgi:very-short-patch-repair endonuclease